MTIPTIASRVTHKRLQAQFKKTYSDLNRATRTFYSDTDIPVHDYDVYVTSGQNTTSSNSLISKFMTYFNGYSQDNTGNWSNFDKVHNIKNLNLNGIETTQYPCDQTKVYTDNVGRLYAMDDTSSAYGKPVPFGPKICVDINGIDKPNKWGHDRFVFVFTEENAVVPYSGKSWNTLTDNLTDKKEIAKYCDKGGSSVQHACAYFAINDISPDGKGSYWYNYLK